MGRQIGIIGGGAAGFFAAITAAEAARDATVTIYEATAHLLAKVKVSGGGRCNVTHACFEPRDLVKKYPRGGRELLGAFSRWQPRDTVEWFAARGVTLKTEEDGRMFPVTDESQTIIDCFVKEAVRLKIKIEMGEGVTSIIKDGNEFTLYTATGKNYVATKVLIATGGSPQAHSYDWI